MHKSRINIERQSIDKRNFFPAKNLLQLSLQALLPTPRISSNKNIRIGLTKKHDPEITSNIFRNLGHHLGRRWPCIHISKRDSQMLSNRLPQQLLSDKPLS